MRKNNLIGQRFARLTVVSEGGVCRKQNIRWICTCDCGGSATAYAYDLRSGRVQSCGCLSREGSRITHGLARGGARRSRVYSIWAAMLQRCGNPRDRGYPRYGGRGITVCRRWRAFENFYADMGDPPEGMSLDRKNNDKGYSAANCRWATRAQQARNTRATVHVTLGGERMVLADALTLLGKSRGVLAYWMRKLNTDHQGVFDIWLPQKRVL
jgi:hypothetical protein